MGVSPDVIPQRPDEPTILVNIENNHPLRGDAAGWRGIGRVLARLSGGRVVYADDKTIRAAFPDEPESADYEELLARYLEGCNPPEYLIGHGASQTLRMLGQGPEDISYFGSVNENYSSASANNRNLVSHHLTRETLEEEGELFDEMHPGIKKPVIAVMLMTGANAEENKDFAARIVRLMEHYPEATIYPTGSRHTHEEFYADLLQALNREIKNQGLEDRLGVIGYQFDRDSEYNPYKGLIARAKHIVVWNGSQSLVSEALFSGRTVYLHGRVSDYSDQIHHGYAATFNELSLDEPPFSKEFEPVNITDEVGSALYKQAQEHRQERKKASLDAVRQTFKNFPAEWLAHLDDIRVNHQRAKNLPDELKESRKFVRAAVQLRGFSLAHFPKFQNNRSVVKLAVRQNPHAIRFASRQMRNDPKIMLHALKRDPMLLRYANDTIRHNPEIVKDAAFWNVKALSYAGETLLDNLAFMSDQVEFNAKAFRYASERLKDNDDFALEAMRRDYENFSSLSQRLKNDCSFITKLLDEEIVSVHDIPSALLKERSFLLKAVALDPVVLNRYKAYNRDPDFALEAVKANASALSFFDTDIQDNDELADVAVAKEAFVYIYLPERQKERRDLALAAVKGYGGIYPHLPEKLRMDQEMALTAIKSDIRYINYIPEELRDDEDIAFYILDHHPKAIPNLGNKYKNDKNFVMKALSHDIGTVRYLSEQMQNDPDVAAYVMENDPDYFQYLGKDAHSNKAYAMKAVSHDANNIIYVPEKLRDDEDIARAVMNDNPVYFEYLGIKARGIKDIALKAIDYNADFVSVLPDNLKDDKDIARLVVNKEPYNLSYLGEKIRSDKDFALEFLKRLPGYVDLFTDTIKNDRDIAEIVIDAGNHYFIYLGEDIRRDKGLIRKALQKYLGNAEAIPSDLLTENPDFYHELLEEYGVSFVRNLNYDARKKYLGDENHVLDLVRMDPETTYDFVSRELYKNPDFMRKLAALPDVKLDYLRLYFLSADAAKAVIEARPEWAENESLKAIINRSDSGYGGKTYHDYYEEALPGPNSPSFHHYDYGNDNYSFDHIDKGSLSAIFNNSFNNAANPATIPAHYEDHVAEPIFTNFSPSIGSLSGTSTSAVLTGKPPHSFMIGNPDTIKETILAGAKHAPQQLFNIIPPELYKDPEFMSQLAATPDLKPGHLKLQELSRDSARAVIKIRPEWAQRPLMQSILEPPLMVSLARTAKPAFDPGFTVFAPSAKLIELSGSPQGFKPKTLTF